MLLCNHHSCYQVCCSLGWAIFYQIISQVHVQMMTYIKSWFILNFPGCSAAWCFFFPVRNACICIPWRTAQLRTELFTSFSYLDRCRELQQDPILSSRERQETEKSENLGDKNYDAQRVSLFRWASFNSTEDISHKTLLWISARFLF